MDNSIVIPMQENKLVSIEDRSVCRAQITKAETALLSMPQVEIPPVHRFSKGVYSREITIPAGTLIVGKIHKHQNLNIISKGDVSFFSVDGSSRVQAPYSWVAEPGVKRVIYAHTDTVWTNVHGTDETDLEKIEDQFIAKDYSEVAGISEEELKLIQEARNELDCNRSISGDRSGVSSRTTESQRETESASG